MRAEVAGDFFVNGGAYVDELVLRQSGAERRTDHA